VGGGRAAGGDGGDRPGAGRRLQVSAQPP
jgi:hypothetical protein